MNVLLVFSLMTASFMLGYIIAMQRVIKTLREQNDLLEQQNKIISDQREKLLEDQSNYWKPKDWEPGDA